MDEWEASCAKALIIVLLWMREGIKSLELDPPIHLVMKIVGMRRDERIELPAASRGIRSHFHPRVIVGNEIKNSMEIVSTWQRADVLDDVKLFVDSDGRTQSIAFPSTPIF